MLVRKRFNMSKPPLILIIAHNIFLTKEERYQLAIENEAIEIIGVSLPVWFSTKHTAAPAEEIFCKYSLYNNPNEVSGAIDLIDSGYRINLPQLPKNWSRPLLTDEQWRAMTEKERSLWYKKNATPKSAFCLLDPLDGGSAYLKFKYLSELEIDEKKLQIVHYCEIKTIELLQQSLT